MFRISSILGSYDNKNLHVNYKLDITWYQVMVKLLYDL